MKTSNNDIIRLPKWAQDRIQQLQLERDAAVRQLNKWQDSQTESPFRVNDYVCTGETCGPTNKVQFIQGHRMECKWEGIEMSIILADRKDNQRGCGVHIVFSPSSHSGIAVVQPRGFNSLSIFAATEQEY